MKKIKLLLFLLATSFVPAMACPVCERQQPEVLKGIVHGAGPESQWDYAIVWTMLAIVALTLFFSVKWLLRPGEKSDTHIKRVILNNQ
ncbi:MAG: hypothetical protein KF862_05045 [Chitinophagaceae bacterium]|nr:hypothetical protein [Chitinophagaceae bacterium]